MHVCRAAVCALLLALVVPAAARADAAETAWVRPVDGAVVRPFDPPVTRFGPGHLGADLRAAPGTGVRAAGAGTVTFAGTVGGTLHVVVAHDGDLRTSYSFLASVAVRRGARVRAGQILGTTGGAHGGHRGDTLHLGLRAGDRYLDPMTLFGAIDLAEVVHLAPVHEPLWRTVAHERRGVLDGLRGLVHGAVDVVGAGAGLVGAAGRSALAALDAVAGPTSQLVHAAGRVALARMREAVMSHPYVRRAVLAAFVARAAVDWLVELTRCDASAPAANGDGGSGHHVMVVGGIDSETGDDGSTVDLATAALGYGPGEVAYYSYAHDAGPYEPEDTHHPIEAAAHRLADQLRELQRRNPGREVDLIAHSQGGVVVLAFLAFVYRPGDPAYPPLGTVVTLSSPLEGAPLATVAADLRRHAPGRAVIEAASAAQRVVGLPIPDPNAPAVHDLSADSDLMRRLGAATLPAHVELTTIGATADYVVPANVATRDGARHTVVETPLRTWANAHSAIVSDPGAMRVVRAAVEGRPLPCRTFDQAMRAAVVPTVLTAVEHEIGNLVPGPVLLP